MTKPRTRLVSLTVDYEIFGNGMGDPKQHILEPTARMAAICERNGMPLTIFFEVEEYLAFARNRDALRKDLGYDPAGLIAEQIVALARRGHDVQLHLHPEWVDCRYQSGKWLLRSDRPTVDSLFETQEETTRYIRSRKAVIDDLLSSQGIPTRVSVYRAGAFCAQPGRKLIRALKETGFVIDSSVVKGMTRHDRYVSLDFSTTPPQRRHWRVTENVAEEDSEGVLVEVPIYSRPGRRIQQLTARRLLAKFSKNIPKEKQRETVAQLGMGRNPAAILRFLTQRFPIKLDYHNMSANQMLRWIRAAPAPPAGDHDVIVTIGHTKEHRDDREFDRFLAGLAKDRSVRVASMSQIAELLGADRAAAA